MERNLTSTGVLLCVASVASIASSEKVYTTVRLRGEPVPAAEYQNVMRPALAKKGVAFLIGSCVTD